MRPLITGFQVPVLPDYLNCCTPGNAEAVLRRSSRGTSKPGGSMSMISRLCKQPQNKCILPTSLLFFFFNRKIEMRLKFGIHIIHCLGLSGYGLPGNVYLVLFSPYLVFLRSKYVFKNIFYFPLLDFSDYVTNNIYFYEKQ